MLAKLRLYKLLLTTCILIHEFDSTHEKSEKLDFHRNTFSCMTTLSLSPLRCCAEGTALKYALRVCLPEVAMTDTERCILSTSPYIWGSRWYYCTTLPNISRTGRGTGERAEGGCSCLLSNSGIIMTSQGTGTAKYNHSSDYKLNETIFLMLSSQWWLSRCLLSLSWRIYPLSIYC